MAAMTIGSMYLASCIFGKQLVDDTQSHGLVMELPPYHKPKWRHILRSSLMKAWDIFWRAFTVIYAVSIVFYLLSYPWGGGDSLLTQIGAVISPVTEFFGMTWQMFMAYLSSMLTKESLLGVINALYSNSDVAAAPSTPSPSASARVWPSCCRRSSAKRRHWALSWPSSLMCPAP